MSACVPQTKAWHLNPLASATRFKIGTSSGFILKSVIGGLLLATISGCDNAPSTTEPQSMGTILGQASADSQSFAKVTPGNHFQFPQDHLAHQDFRQEWWYLTANLTTENGEQLGAQWTQFRVALKPKHTGPQNEGATPKSTWATEQLYFAHSALTSSTYHLAHEKWSRAHPSLADVSADPYQIRLDNWQWRSQSNELFPATLSVATDDFSYQLELNSQAPLQYQGDKGYSIKSRDGKVASYYYSQPFITIHGEITRHIKINGQVENRVEKVTGQGWLDREWSSQFLNKSQQGWDWFALRLDDGSALMLFQLREQFSDKAQSAFYSARRMFADGTGRNINSRDTPDGIKMTPLEWQTTSTGKYPIRWQVQIPSEQIDIRISPLNPNSAMALSTSYWEGPIELKGSHSGTGYMELTGY
ncbi:carotenoid 1,2-hydratase [Shewanella seohaensis]|uniref:lipocalin-like domain-containing protein n=1 Tax=Shewanella seohaensis TaxID=755175 RepID=UPI00201079D1|nr:lipocalin-like domain-containing protein [Shewanella seohaensis]MCL1120556.1 carotenoid 1,2-hydratase [Shewanella seohaensis]UXM83122.1 carotenoid 1,2-hydratase [Shewanella seohaensis]